MVESSRILLFVYVIGLGSIQTGFKRIRGLFTQINSRKASLQTAQEKLKKQWGIIYINFVGFLIIAWCMNMVIDLIAYETCLYLKLTTNGILNPASSEWTLLLFFKNLSMIPLTLVFEGLLLLWSVNRLWAPPTSLRASHPNRNVQ